MKKIVISLLLAYTYGINAQSQPKQSQRTPSSHASQFSPIHAATLHAAQTATNTNLKNTAQGGYIWGPLTFPSTSIIREGENFSVLSIQVDELPRKAHNMS